MNEQPKVEITGRECKFAVHIPAKSSDDDDLHYIKERLHFSDGTSKPNIRVIKNYPRKFWITKRAFRNHQDKKEWESFDKLDEYECTQSQLRDQVARRIDKGWGRDPLKKLAHSPYVYGTSMSSTSLIKKNEYKDKWPDAVSAETLAVLDIETNMLEKNEEPIMCTVIFEDTVKIAILNKMVDGYQDKEARFWSAVDKYVTTPVKDRNKLSIHAKESGEKKLEDDVVPLHDLKIEVKFVDTQKEMFKHCFDYLHEVKPDFLAIWNMDFDIPRIMKALENEGVDPAEIFCDPKLPAVKRLCRYKQGTQQKRTASGKNKPMNPAEQWHTLFLSASFYVIDAMCAYRYLRLGNQEESSYSLDYILTKILKGKVQKLKFKEADGYTGAAWHEHMQANYIFEYAAYNIWDCLCMIFLDEKTQDLRLTFNTSAYISDFENFKSLPKRISDAFYFDLLAQNFVLGDPGAPPPDKPDEEEVMETEEEDVPDDDDDPYAEYTTHLGLHGWILTLASHLQALGLPMVKETEQILTGLRAFVYDSDAVSAYPTCTAVANVSKETTKKELITIIGKDEYLFRMQNLNLVLGGVNAIEYSTVMFEMDKPGDVLAMFENGTI